MFTIGDFARHGRVSVRILRHYDAIALLRPARAGPAGGYRFYEAGQLPRPWPAGSIPMATAPPVTRESPTSNAQRTTTSG
jgi:hypothetical protein